MTGEDDLNQEAYPKSSSDDAYERLENDNNDDENDWEEKDVCSDNSNNDGDIDQMMDIDEGSFDYNLNKKSLEKGKIKKSRFLEDYEEEKEIEIETDKKEKTYLEKSKMVGRIGPLLTKLHLDQMSGNIKQFDQ